MHFISCWRFELFWAVSGESYLVSPAFQTQRGACMSLNLVCEVAKRYLGCFGGTDRTELKVCNSVHEGLDHGLLGFSFCRG